MTLKVVDPEAREATLRERVRDVYAAFRGYRLAPQFIPDGCYPFTYDDRPLRADSLRRLPPAAFEGYQWRAITTWGSVDDFKHFLPRILEIIATAEADGAGTRIEAWLVFSKLRCGEWRQWKNPERQAMDAYFDALWSALLARPVIISGRAWEAQTLGDLLRGFAETHDDLTPFLRQWEAEAGHPAEGLLAAAYLARMIVDARDNLLKNGSMGWDWPNRPESRETPVLAWLASDVVVRLLETAFFRWSETPYAALISEGHYWLGWWRQRLPAGA